MDGKLYQLSKLPSGITVEIGGQHWVCVGKAPAKKSKKSKKAKKE
tara:strand:+ start:256 stop:390 length:135 start_codon:yes stop_codon:yes gene_type:complete